MEIVDLDEQLQDELLKIDPELNGTYHSRRKLHSLYCWTWLETLHHAVSFLSKDSVIVDLGCGSGLWLAQLAARGFTNLHGTDASQDILDTAQALSSAMGYDIKFTLDGTLNVPQSPADMVTVFGWAESCKIDGHLLSHLEFTERITPQLAVGGKLSVEWYCDEDVRRPQRTYLKGQEPVVDSRLEEALKMTRKFKGREIALYIYQRTS